MKTIKLQAASRRNPNAEFMVTKASSRIGSGEECDCRIPDRSVPKVALVLENRKGEFFVHNRTSNPVKIGSKIFKEKSFEWDSSHPLYLGKVLKLNLLITEQEFNGEDSVFANVADLKELEASWTKNDDKSDPKKDGGKPKKNQTQQLLAVVLVLGILGYLIYEEVRPKNNGGAAAIATYEDAIEEFADQRVFQQQIQYAESRYELGDNETANRLFRQLRNELDSVDGYEATKQYLARRITGTSE